MTQTTPQTEREFRGTGMATIFGAPISWIALFGALMGALSIVPMIFYPFGGGFASAGMVVFGPLSGMVLGPFAGTIAGIIGGLIGMFISPASYPLGLIDVFLSGALLPLLWGLAHPRYRKYFVPLMILYIIFHLIWPYTIPGEAGGFAPVKEPNYFLSYIWAPLGVLSAIFLQKRFLMGMDSDKLVTRLASFILYNFAPLTFWLMPWIGFYFFFLNYPPDLATLNLVVSWWFYILPISVASGIVAMLLVRALERSGLRRVPGSVLDREGE
jgi:hypothetical protein